MNLKNRILSTVLALCTVFSLCVPFFAEPTIEIDFKMTATPKHIFEMDVETIKEFFKEEETSVIFNSSITTTDYGMMILDGKYSLEKIAILSFKITDANTYINEDPEADLQKLKDEIFNDAVSSIKTRQISTCIYTYDSIIKTEETDDGELNVYIHIAFYLGDDFASIEALKDSFVKPTLYEWKGLTDAQKIIRLNSFILNGQFSYDTEETYRSSTKDFIDSKKGTSRDYAGLTALFLDEMGLENIIVSGQIINDDDQKVSHFWNMVKIGDQWYHLDILMNGPINKKGKHTEITEDYLLKASRTMAKDHFTDSEYDQYTALATSNYTIKDTDRPEQPKQEEPKPEKPVISEIDAERLTLSNLLAQGYDIIMNHSEEYTPESIKNLISIYNDSREIYINLAATLSEIKAAQTMLTTIMSSLATPEAVNKDGLFSALGSAYEMLFYPEVAVLYPASSLRDLEKVYNNAVSVYTNDNATQNQVNNARWSLWSKINEIKDSIKEPEPTVPDTPTTPEVPETPTTPETPETPTTPEIPETPTTPETPETPIEPENPIEPEPPIEPDEPVKPDEPTAPEVPVDPVVPDNPTQPSTPTEPTNPTEPNEEKKFSTDIILYAILALVAAGGITFLIIDGAKKRKYYAAAEAEEQNNTNTNIDMEDDDDTLENVVIPQVDSAENADESEDKEVDSSEIVIAEVKSAEKKETEDIDDSEIRIVSAAEAAEKEREKASAEEKKEDTTEEAKEAETNETEKSSDETDKETSEVSEKDEAPAENNTEDEGSTTVNAEESEAKESSDAQTSEPQAEDSEESESKEEKSSEEEKEEAQPKNEAQMQKEVEANQNTAVNILKQIKKRKKELNNHEKM